MKGAQNETPEIRLFTLPNLLTLCNLLCGGLAAIFALRYEGLQMAFFMIVAAGIFDFLDGFTARLMGNKNPALGVQLDSLADVISFGLAPSAILVSIYQQAGGRGELCYVVLLLAAFSALRLAKFNIDTRQRDHFIGLPTPAAALFVASAGYMYEGGVYAIHPYVTLVAVVVLSALLISNIPMFALKFKSYGIRGNELRYLFLALSAAALLLLGWGGVAAIIVLYILLSVTCWIVCPSTRKR